MGFMSSLMGGIPIVGDALAMGMEQHNYNEQMRFSQGQFDWQKQKWAEEMNMANTAHQREVADLKAAGLNPILSVTGGRGAPVASGGGGGAPLPGAPKFDTKGFSSAVAFQQEKRRIDNESKIADATVAEKMAQAETQRVLARVAETTIPEAQSRIDERLAHVGLMDSQGNVNRQMIEELLAKIKLYQSEANEKNWSARYIESRIPQADALSALANVLLGLLGGVKGGKESGSNIGAALDTLDKWAPFQHWPEFKEPDFVTKLKSVPSGLKGLLDFFKNAGVPSNGNSGTVHGGVHSSRQVDRW